jgi:hypothetical protein
MTCRDLVQHNPSCNIWKEKIKYDKKKKRLYDIVGMDFVSLTFVKSNIWNFLKKQNYSIL